MTLTANNFEDRLLDALLDRFDAQRLQSPADLMSAKRRPSIRRYAVPVGCLAAAATAASLILELGGPAPVKPVTTTTPSYALAAWTMKPTSAGPTQISAAEARCSASFAQNERVPATGRRKAGPSTSGRAMEAGGG